MPANNSTPSEMENEQDEYYKPWPSDTNDKPFMTYEKLQTGAPGKAPLK